MSHRRSNLRATKMIEMLENRVLMRSLGIDVSDFQGDITVAEWQQIKAAGKDFAFAKATEGLTFNAGTFTNNITRAPQAGVLIGAYHYGRPDNNAAVAEADHFIQVISPYLTAGRVRPVLDIEVDAGDVTFMSNWVNDFCNRVKNVTGISPLVYTGQSFASTNFNSSVTQWPLWIARYPNPTPDPQTASPGSTTPWPTWRIWQYSSTGSVPGIAGNVDLNVYNGELAQFTSEFVITAPEITVLRNTTNIADGATTPIDFGTVQAGATPPTITFTVRNDGNQTLTLGGVVLPVGFTIAEALSTSLAGGASDTFTVRLETSVVGTKSGSVQFSNNDANENPFNFAISGTVIPSDPTPPSVVSSTFLFETAPHKVEVGWSEAVGASLVANDFQITNLTTLGTLSPTHSYNAATNVSTLNFGGTVADGNYRLRVLAGNVQDGAGNNMAADYTFDFFVFRGDANRDRTVNISDFSVVAANFNLPGTFSQGNFNYDALIDINDFSLLASRFNTSLPVLSVVERPAPADLPRSLGFSTNVRMPIFSNRDALDDDPSQMLFL